MATTAPVQTRPETAERILDAAFERVGDVGLARTTMEDVARQAGLARQTLYRYFPSKDQLIIALVLREEQTFIEGARRAFAADGDLEEALCRGTLYCLNFARQHPLLDRLLSTDAETLLPYLNTRAAPVVRRATEAFVDELGRKPWVRWDLVEEVADVAVRMTISYALNPPGRPADRIARDLARILAMALTGKEADR
jgi:AcrR family transcriptional regulator